ncbi:hypothetical protein Plhal304r1_c094g0172881 [Plasmopara halstedii]
MRSLLARYCSVIKQILLDSILEMLLSAIVERTIRDTFRCHD